MDLARASLSPCGVDALEAVLDRITALKSSQKAIDAELAPLLDALSGALDAGELDEAHALYFSAAVARAPTFTPSRSTVFQPEAAESSSTSTRWSSSRFTSST